MSGAVNVVINVASKRLQDQREKKKLEGGRKEEGSLWSHKHSLKLSRHNDCHAVNMMFSANVHRSITGEVEKWRVPGGGFLCYANVFRVKCIRSMSSWIQEERTCCKGMF